MQKPQILRDVSPEMTIVTGTANITIDTKTNNDVDAVSVTAAEGVITAAEESQTLATQRDEVSNLIELQHAHSSWACQGHKSQWVLGEPGGCAVLIKASRHPLGHSMGHCRSFVRE